MNERNDDRCFITAFFNTAVVESLSGPSLCLEEKKGLLLLQMLFHPVLCLQLNQNMPRRNSLKDKCIGKIPTHRKRKDRNSFAFSYFKTNERKE